MDTTIKPFGKIVVIAGGANPLKLLRGSYTQPFNNHNKTPRVDINPISLSIETPYIRQVRLDTAACTSTHHYGGPMRKYVNWVFRLNNS